MTDDKYIDYSKEQCEDVYDEEPEEFEETPKNCPDCNGTGEQKTPLGLARYVCPTCGGSGKHPDPGEIGS